MDHSLRCEPRHRPPEKVMCFREGRELVVCRSAVASYDDGSSGYSKILWGTIESQSSVVRGVSEQHLKGLRYRVKVSAGFTEG